MDIIHAIFDVHNTLQMIKNVLYVNMYYFNEASWCGRYKFIWRSEIQWHGWQRM